MGFHGLVGAYTGQLIDLEVWGDLFGYFVKKSVFCLMHRIVIAKQSISFLGFAIRAHHL